MLKAQYYLEKNLEFKTSEPFVAILAGTEPAMPGKAEPLDISVFRCVPLTSANPECTFWTLMLMLGNVHFNTDKSGDCAHYILFLRFRSYVWLTFILASVFCEHFHPGSASFSLHVVFD